MSLYALYQPQISSDSIPYLSATLKQETKKHLRRSINAPGMMCARPNIHVNAIQPIPIIKLLNWLTDPRIAEVSAKIDFVVHESVAFTAPHSEFHLVVCVVGACIEDIDITSLVACANVSIPQIAMDERWFYGTPFGFEGAEEGWDHRGDDAR